MVVSKSIYNKYIKKQREKKDVGSQVTYLQSAQKHHQKRSSYKYGYFASTDAPKCIPPDLSFTNPLFLLI